MTIGFFDCGKLALAFGEFIFFEKNFRQNQTRHISDLAFDYFLAKSRLFRAPYLLRSESFPCIASTREISQRLNDIPFFFRSSASATLRSRSSCARRFTAQIFIRPSESRIPAT
jgi:hypothetical protein